MIRRLGCVFRETFDGSSDCGNWGAYATCDNSWFYGTGADPSYTTSPVYGVRSAYYTALNNYFIMDISAEDTYYIALAIKFSALPAASNHIAKLQKSDGSDFCTMFLYSTDQIVIQNAGGTQQATSVSLSTDTVYYFMLKAVKGTGANASCTPYYSTNGTSWTTGTASTNGTWTEQVGRATFYGTNSVDKWADDIRCSTSTINYW